MKTVCVHRGLCLTTGQTAVCPYTVALVLLAKSEAVAHSVLRPAMIQIPRAFNLYCVFLIVSVQSEQYSTHSPTDVYHNLNAQTVLCALISYISYNAFHIIYIYIYFFFHIMHFMLYNLLFKYSITAWPLQTIRLLYSYFQPVLAIRQECSVLLILVGGLGVLVTQVLFVSLIIVELARQGFTTQHFMKLTVLVS